MLNYLFVGDNHGDLAFIEQAAAKAAKHTATLIQAGDWGFLWPYADKLEELSTLLEHADPKSPTQLRFCCGNHDDHPRLKKLRGRVRVRGVEIAKNVIYQPRGSVHEDDDGTRFLFLGGAPSIDRAGRVEGKSWWPEETITTAEFIRAKSVCAPIHVLVTHDAPTFPPGFTPKGSPSYQRDQLRSMDFVDRLIRHHKPTLHIHGHWHTQYSRTHKNGTLTIGLNCNEIDSSYLDEATLLWSRPIEKENA